jgi:hypothetical protein
MYSTYRLKADELSADFIQALKKPTDIGKSKSSFKRLRMKPITFSLPITTKSIFLVLSKMSKISPTWSR